MSENKTFKILVEHLKSSNHEKILFGLKEIKKRCMNNNKDVYNFRSLGLVEYLIKFIQKPNEEILNSSLSLMSICSLFLPCQQQIFKLGGVDHLVNLYKCSASGSIKLRACRAIANQSRHEDSRLLFVSLNVINIILEHLKETTDEETINVTIRAVRLLAVSGESCQNVILSDGITIICEKGLLNEPSLPQLKETLKAIAHFARVAHSSATNQLMACTENLMLITKHHTNEDTEVYSLVLWIIVNVVKHCFDTNSLRSESFDARVIDHLCTAHVPSIIVAELKQIKKSNLKEEMLISSLCKFCQGSSQCHNLAKNSFSQPPTFLGRAWMQLMECGGVSLLVQLLYLHKDNQDLQSLIYGALLGIEHNYSFKEKVVKHCLAANLIPILAEQFDCAIKKYAEARRPSEPNKCVHTIKNPDSNSNPDGTSISQDINMKETEEPTKMEGVETLGDKNPQSPKKMFKNYESLCHNPLGLDYIIPINSKSCSMSPPYGVNRSASCSTSPTGVQRASSPTSPTLSNSSMNEFSYSNTVEVPRGGYSPPYGTLANAPSPPPSMSPIRCPSDWDEDEDQEDGCDSEMSGRFSPSVPEGSCNLEENEIDMVDDTNPENSEDQLKSEDPSCCQMSEEIGEKLTINNDSPKRKKSPPNFKSCPDNKNSDFEQGFSNLSAKLEPNSSSNMHIDPKLEPKSENTNANSNDNQSDQINPEPPTKMDEDTLPEHLTQNRNPENNSSHTQSRIKEMSQIKFRVGKKTGVKRKVTLLSKPQPKQNLDDLWQESEIAKSIESNSPPSSPKSPLSPRAIKKPKLTPIVKSRPKNLLDPTPEEAKSLKLLEWVVRLMNQISVVKEAIMPVCREFVPRVIRYLSSAQMVNNASTQMLVSIAKNPLSIQPLLDTQFISYVGVELCESVANAENPCEHCTTMEKGGYSFLDQMNKFFSHVHQYGTQEIFNRLHPDKERDSKQACVFAIPHVMRCPKLLHNFMVRCSGIDIMLELLSSDVGPDSAKFMYATSALHKLAVTLQVDYQLKQPICLSCIQDEEMSTLESETIDQNNTSVKKTDESKQCKGHPNICHWASDDNKNITFRLDDESKVAANRELLASRNQILKGMLKGSFSESKNENVDLSGISQKCLKFLIHFLYGCTCDVYTGGDAQFYLELVFVAQMYLLPKLGRYAASEAVSHIEEADDVLRIYESGVGRLHEDAVLGALCTVLVKPMKTWKRARWLKYLFNSKYGEDIIHNITMIVKYPLEVNCDVCCCDMSQCLYKVSETVYEKL